MDQDAEKPKKSQDAQSNPQQSNPQQSNPVPEQTEQPSEGTRRGRSRGGRNRGGRGSDNDQTTIVGLGDHTPQFIELSFKERSAG